MNVSSPLYFIEYNFALSLFTTKMYQQVVSILFSFFRDNNNFTYQTHTVFYFISLYNYIVVNRRNEEKKLNRSWSYIVGLFNTKDQTKSIFIIFDNFLLLSLSPLHQSMTTVMSDKDHHMFLSYPPLLFMHISSNNFY